MNKKKRAEEKSCFRSELNVINSFIIPPPPVYQWPATPLQKSFAHECKRKFFPARECRVVPQHSYEPPPPPWTLESSLPPNKWQLPVEVSMARWPAGYPAIVKVVSTASAALVCTVVSVHIVKQQYCLRFPLPLNHRRAPFVVHLWQFLWNSEEWLSLYRKHATAVSSASCIFPNSTQQTLPPVPLQQLLNIPAKL